MSASEQNKVVKTIGALVREVQDAKTPLEGAQTSSDLMIALRDATSTVARLRRGFFRLLLEQGYELADIGEMLDPPITKERVRQIVDA